MSVWDFFGVYLAGRYFHRDLDLNLLFLADLPSLAIGALPQDALVSSSASQVTQSYLDALVWLSFGTLQWWGVGIVIAARRANRRHTVPPPTTSRTGITETVTAKRDPS
jgi:hypothetical protein